LAAGGQALGRFGIHLGIEVDHPPTRDADTPLDGRRRLAAWMTVVIFVLIFIPQPLTMARQAPVFEGERTPVAWQAHRPATPPRIRFVVPFSLGARGDAPPPRIPI
jgi:hypothetical protein